MQVSDFKVGDKVTIVATVVEVLEGQNGLLVKTPHGFSVSVDVCNIAAHSPKPREIKVGALVRLMDEDSWMEVKLIGDRQMVVADASGYLGVYRLDTGIVWQVQ